MIDYIQGQASNGNDAARHLAVIFGECFVGGASMFETFPPPDTWRAVIAQPRHSVQTFLFHTVEKIG